MEWLQKIWKRESPVMGFSWEEFLGTAIVVGGVLIGVALCVVSLVIGSVILPWIALGIASVGIPFGAIVMLRGSFRRRSSRI